MADMTDCFQFLLIINRSILSRIGNIHHPRLNHVFRTGIIHMCLISCLNLLRCYLSFTAAWQCQYFMSCCLNCPRLMHIDMTAGSCQNSLIWPKNRTDNGRIGLCAANQKLHINILTAAGLTDQTSRLITIRIQPVSRGLIHICLYHTFQNLRMSAFCIITLKLYHCSTSKNLPRNTSVSRR